MQDIEALGHGFALGALIEGFRVQGSQSRGFRDSVRILVNFSEVATFD